MQVVPTSPFFPREAAAECVRIKRDPCVRDVSIFLPVVTISDIPLAETATRLGARVLAGDIARNVLTGSPESIKQQIQTYLDAGATRVIITTRPGINHEVMRRFAHEIMPAFRQQPTAGVDPSQPSRGRSTDELGGR